MNVKEFSTRIVGYNHGLENVLNTIEREAPLLNTSAMLVEKNHLENERQRNDLGLIRVIFLGETSSGKSTMINAMAGKIIVPEVPHTSTMIPTWIGYTADFEKEGVCVYYYPRSENEEAESVDGILDSKKESVDDFRCYYCYRPEDAADPERLIVPERFRSMKLDEAYMHIQEKNGMKNGLMSRFSLTLVDTLGNGATRVDDLKAQHNMDDVDMAFVLLNEAGTISKESRGFLASRLFKSKIKPEHIVFVINKIDRSQSVTDSKNNCKQAIKAVLNDAYGENVPTGLEEKICSQIVPYSALYNRLWIAGSYPYKSDSLKINNLTEDEFVNPKDMRQKEIVEIVENKETFEGKIRKNNSDEDLKNEGHYADLEKTLEEVVRNMFVDGTIVENHLRKTENMAKSLVKCVEERLKAFNQEMENIQTMINKFESVKEELCSIDKKFKSDTERIIELFPNNNNTYLKNNQVAIRMAYSAKIEPIVASIGLSKKLRDNYTTAKQLRNLSVQEMNDIFVPEYNSFKNKIVVAVCNVICDNIFRSQVKTETARTPYSDFIEKIQQSIQNYIASYIEKINTVNIDNRFSIVTVDKDIFQKYADQKLNELVIRLIETVQSKTDDIINVTIASKLKKSIHTLSSTWHKWWHNDDVSYFYKKMDEAARVTITEAVYRHVAITLDKGFIDDRFRADIIKQLGTIIDFSKEQMKSYSEKVSGELYQLRDSYESYKNEEARYNRFAEENVRTPLAQMLSEIERLKENALNGGMEY